MCTYHTCSCCTGIHARVWICVEAKHVISQGPFTLFSEAGSLTEDLELTTWVGLAGESLSIHLSDSSGL